MKTKSKKEKWNFVGLVLLCCCMLYLAVGCGNTSSGSGSAGSAQKPLNDMTASDPANGNESASSGVNPTDSERRMLADRICRTVEEMEGVQDASVLIADASDHGTSAAHSSSAGKSPVSTESGNDDTGRGSASSVPNTSASDRSSNTGNVSGTGYMSGKTAASQAENGMTQNGAYVAIIGVTCTDTLKNEDAKQRSLAQNIRQEVMRSESSIGDVIVTADDKDIENIGRLAGNMLENAGQDASDEINRLRDTLRDAGTNLLNAAKDVTNGVADGLKELTR